MSKILERTAAQLDASLDKADGAVRYDAAQMLTAAQQHTAQKNIGATWQSNPNLLDNWCFLPGCTVNQRGQTSYPGDSFGIDRWFLSNEVNTLTVNNGYLSFTGNSAGAAMEQTYEDVISVGMTCTLSALLRSSTQNCGIQIRYEDNTFTDTVLANGTGEWELVTMTLTPTKPIKRVRVRAFVVESTFDVLAVKFELGDQQTLAHQDADGNWVLNELPNYADQLARCQRHLVVIKNTVAFPAYISSSRTQILMTVPLPVTMRTTPSISYSGQLVVRGVSGYCSDASVTTPYDGAVFTAPVFTSVGLMLNIKKSDNTEWAGLTNNTPVSVQLYDSPKLILSAEL